MGEVGKISEFVLSLLSTLGLNGILLLVIQRFFKKKDEKDEHRMMEHQEIFDRLDTGLETLRIFAYNSMAAELDRLIDKGYATSAERRMVDEMYRNYEAHGWNGDMRARLEKVYALETHEDRG